MGGLVGLKNRASQPLALLSIMVMVVVVGSNGPGKLD